MYTQQATSTRQYGTQSSLAQTIPSTKPTLNTAGAQTMSSPIPSASAAVNERLVNLSAQFNRLHLELDAVRQEKLQQEQRRYNTLQSQVSLLREALATESSNRSQSLRSLQSWVEERMQQWRQEVETPLTNRISTVENQMTKLMNRVSSLETEQTRNKEYMPILVEELGAGLTQKIQDCMNVVESERKVREEHESKIEVRLQEVGRRLREQILGEREVNVQRYDELKLCIVAEGQARDRDIGRMEDRLRDTRAALEDAVEREKEERVAGEQTLAQVLADSTAAMVTNAQIMARH